MKGRSTIRDVGCGSVPPRQQSRPARKGNLSLAGFLLASFLAGAALVAGCASTATRNFDVDLSRFKKVYFADDISLFDQKYVPKVATALEQCGLNVTTNREGPDVIVCRLAIDQTSVWNFRVNISLWEGREALVVAEATNPGFGNWLARDASVASLLDSAIHQLQKKLRQTKSDDVPVSDKGSSFGGGKRQ
jgi:hypothetical protein